MYVAYTKQGHQAGDLGAKLFVCVRLSISASSKGLAREAGHRSSEIQDSHIY